MVEETKTEIQEVDTKPNLLEQIKALKTENDRKEKLIAQEKELLEIKILSGNARAGEPIKTPEDLKKDEAQRIADEITNAFR
jgi:hypothetical protein